MSLSTQKNRIRCMYFTYIFQHSKRNLVSPSGHVMFYSLYKHQWNSKPFHLNTFFFCCERRDLLCSHSNGDLFTCENNVFARKFSWYFIGVCIITCFPLTTFKQSRSSLWRIKTDTYYVVNQSGVKTKPAGGSKRGKCEWQAAISICLTSDWSR